MHRFAIGRVTIGFVVAVGGAFAIATPAANAGAPLPGPNVKIESDSASIDTFQALNSTDTRSRNKDGSDFVGFGESLNPSTLSGPEGKADAFVSQAATIITPSSAAFPTGPLNGIGVSGRLLDRGTKSTNPAPGVPVASSEGSFSADFSTSGPTPFQFDGSLNATNTDADDCTEITVELTGPVNRAFSATGGADCVVQHHQEGWVITDVLPAGDYTLNVDYDTTVDPENPGSETGRAALEVNLLFFRKCSIVGTSGANTLNGTPGDDVICGRGGNDTINGLAGNDEVFAGTGNDIVSGGGGDDALHGEVGNDRVSAASGDDVVDGSFGDDRLSGGDDKDTLKGEDGDDTVRGQADADVLDGGAGRDNLSGGGANDRIRARDHTRDDVSGGGGNHDVATVDRRDHVTGVETIH